MQAEVYKILFQGDNGLLLEANWLKVCCGLLPWTIDGQDEVEIAYMIDKAYWRQGLASEAVLAIRDYGFNTLHLPRLICLIDKENVASINTARKIGMSFEKEGEDEMGPFQLYAVANPKPG